MIIVRRANVYTTNHGRHLTPAEVRACVLRGIREEVMCTLWSSDQRVRAADLLMADETFMRWNHGCTGRALGRAAGEAAWRRALHGGCWREDAWVTSSAWRAVGMRWLEVAP